MNEKVDEVDLAMPIFWVQTYFLIQNQEGLQLTSKLSRFNQKRARNVQESLENSIYFHIYEKSRFKVVEWKMFWIESRSILWFAFRFNLKYITGTCKADALSTTWWPGWSRRVPGWPVALAWCNISFLVGACAWTWTSRARNCWRSQWRLRPLRLCRLLWLWSSKGVLRIELLRCCARNRAADPCFYHNR